jgi:hypothetical protein
MLIWESRISLNFHAILGLFFSVVESILTRQQGNQRRLYVANADVILRGIFSDPRFREFGRYRLFAEIEGVRFGVVLATRSPRYDNFALNKTDLERLIAGKREGKVDQAFVVMARVNTANAMAYCDSIDAEKLHEALQGLRPRTGSWGDFWVLPPNFTTAGMTASDEEPF